MGTKNIQELNEEYKKILVEEYHNIVKFLRSEGHNKPFDEHIFEMMDEDMADYERNVSRTITLYLPTYVTGKYLYSRWGHKAFGGTVEPENANGFNVWHFIDKECPVEPKCEYLKELADKAEKKGDTKAEDAIRDYLFIVSLKTFLHNKFIKATSSK